MPETGILQHQQWVETGHGPSVRYRALAGFMSSALVRPERTPAHRVYSVAAERAGQRRPREKPGEGSVTHIEAAGIGAEGRQDQPLAIGDEAAAAHAAARGPDPRCRVQVARHLAGLQPGLGLMA